MMLAVLSVIHALAAQPACEGEDIRREFLFGVWEAYDYEVDRFFSLKLEEKDGASTMLFLAGPPHDPGATALSVQNLSVRGRRLDVQLGNRTMKVAISGCVDAVEDWGLLTQGSLILSGPNGEFPQTLFLEFTKGAYLRRRWAYNSVAADIRKKGIDSIKRKEPKTLVTPDQLPPHLQDLERPSDVLVDPDDAEKSWRERMKKRSSD